MRAIAVCALLCLIGCAASTANAPIAGNIAADPIEWYQPAPVQDAGLTQSLRPNPASVNARVIALPTSGK